MSRFGIVCIGFGYYSHLLFLPSDMGKTLNSLILMVCYCNRMFQVMSFIGTIPQTGTIPQDPGHA